MNKAALLKKTCRLNKCLKLIQVTQKRNLYKSWGSSLCTVRREQGFHSVRMRSPDLKIKERKVASCYRDVNRGLSRLSNTGIFAQLSVYSNCLSRRNVKKGYGCQARFYSSDVEDGRTNIDLDNDDEGYDDAEIIKQGEQFLQDELYKNFIKQYCAMPGVGHRVFILQIVVTGSLKSYNTSPGHLQLAENVALVQSIPGWVVVDSEIVKVKEPRSMKMMEKAFSSVTEKIKLHPTISAVFISRNILKAEQIELAQSKWNFPIFDRSFILTQVFKAQAQSRESKLHVALAELPIMRLCAAHGLQLGQYGSHQKHKIRWPFLDHEKKIKAALALLDKQRVMVRNKRSTRQIPTIAVIGYTNCGKTTLIKALTGDEDMVPQDKLFATLDVTAHGGILPNNMMVVFMDTVGFLTDLPINLTSAFTATLEDTLNADLIVHVRDVSHPDMESQKLNVLQSIKKMLPKDKLDSMVEVCNKMDRIEQWQRSDLLGSMSGADVFCVSAVTGEGMEELRHVVQERLLQNIDYLQKKIKIPLNGPHMGWLYKAATVVSTETVVNDEESLIMNVYISKANYSKFIAHFRPRNRVQNQAVKVKQ